ncbi:Trans-resveratrol di-O-methyltransferase [Bienertia sinuspersici]
MEANNISNTEAKKELLDAISHAFNHGVSFLNSMALECAVELGISDAIKKHGNPMTLDELVTTLSIHPNKGESLRQLIRLLVHSNFYTTQVLVNGEEAYDLTINSQILLKDHPLSQAPLVALIRLNPLSNEPSSHSISLAKWFRKQDEGTHLYQGIMPNDSKLNESFNQAMASDSRMVGSLLMGSDEFNGLIQGVESLVDWILHNWSDESCIKVLKLCKEAIPSKDKGGKLLIIDMVVGVPSDNVKHSKSQYLANMHMMFLFGGKERNEQEWKSLFTKAGFSHYNILPILGSRSVIEVYPA